MSKTTELPIHFFTIVLNGEPFIRRHIEMLQSLPFEWHWHIIEGVAALVRDTGWSLANGGRIHDTFHEDGLSNDGTREYLDELKAAFPDRVHVYRKPSGVFWDGKLEMVNAPLSSIQEHCLLWQIDVDEFWTPEQIIRMRELFLKHKERNVAFFWCHFLVGQELVISTRDTYGNNSGYEWMRVWRYRPGHRWVSHEPPHLVGRWERFRQFLRTPFRAELQFTFQKSSLSAFTHAETEAEGLVFQHLAYVQPSQLAFKEKYYGYTGALAQWEELQRQTEFPVLLRNYFGWVEDEALVQRASSLGIRLLEFPRD